MIRGNTSATRCMTWLTAAMTLVTAAPHAFCVCADGTVKPLAFALAAAVPAQSCCTPRRTNPPARHAAPRCPHCQKTTRRPAGDSPALSRSSCCHRASVPATLFTATHRGAPVAGDLDAARIPALSSADATLSPAPAFTPAWGERRPPPTDRVVTLRHFLI